VSLLRIFGYSGAPDRTWMLRIGYNRSSDRVMRDVMRESARPAGSPGKWRFYHYFALEVRAQL